MFEFDWLMRCFRVQPNTIFLIPFLIVIIEAGAEDASATNYSVDSEYFLNFLLGQSRVSVYL